MIDVKPEASIEVKTGGDLGSSNVTLSLVGTPVSYTLPPEVGAVTSSPNEAVVRIGRLAKQDQLLAPGHQSGWLSQSSGQ